MTFVGDFAEKCGLSEAEVKDLSRYHGVPFDIALGVVAVESSGRAKILRFEKKYKWLYGVKVFARKFGWTEDTETALQRFSYGLMQIMLATARGHGFKNHPMDLLEPQIGFSWGCYHLSTLFNRYQNWNDAVSAYNWGHVKRKLLKPKQYKNQKYVDEVFRYARRFRCGQVQTP